MLPSYLSLPEGTRVNPYDKCYAAGIDGSVWSFRTGKKWKKLAPAFDSKGRKQVRMSGVLVFVHHVVLATFVSPCPEGMEACHNDGDCTNNCLSNLRWDTKLSNMADMRKHGTLMMGESHVFSKLKEKDILAIRKLRKEGFTLQAIANKFGIVDSHAYQIVNRVRWSHI